jgi:phage major head subunit gpT-like protein
MGALTPTTVRELESEIKAIIVDDYARLSANMWWQNVAKVRQTATKKTILAWLLSTAQIRETGGSGNIGFEDLVSQITEIETKHARAAFEITRDQLTDVYNGEPGGEGVEAAMRWAKDIAYYMAYWPQKKTSEFLKTAHLAAASGGFDSYDGVPFFSTSHTLNPYRASVGTFKNLFTGGDAAPIDTGVTMDVAADNLSKVWALIKAIKMPNGEDPRGLTPRALIVPPKMFPRAKQLTSADFIAQAAAGGGAGSTDFRQFLASMGFATPICADELSGFESETTYFVVAEQHANSDLGGVVYVEREPFRMTQYGEMTDAVLSRMSSLEWHLTGRNAIAPGHPFLLFKVQAA